MIPEDLRKMLDNGDCQLMMVTFEEGNGSDRTLKAVDEIKSLMNSQMFLGGLAAVINDTKMLIEQELPLYVAVAVGLSLVVLFLAYVTVWRRSSSYWGSCTPCCITSEPIFS